MNTEENIKLSNFFKIFADTTRIKILNTLLESDKCVKEICESVEMSSSSVSHQLSTLRSLNLVKTQKIGQTVKYKISDEHIKIILEYGLEHIREGVLWYI